MVIETFELRMTNGMLYVIKCSRKAIDELIDIIGEANIDYVEDV